MATFLAFRIPKRLHHQVQPNEAWVSRATSFQQLFNRLASSPLGEERERFWQYKQKGTGRGAFLL